MSTPQGPYQQNQPPRHAQPYGAPPPPQYGPPPQQYGQPPAQQYGQPEGIAVTTQFFPLAWLFFFVKPKIFVGGQEMPRSGWGRTVLPARPGQHHVHVYTPYILPPRLGPADATVDVWPGQLTELEYKAPLWSFSPGSLGVGPQKYNGLGIMLAIAAIAAVVALLVILLSVIVAV